jgi:multidrug efflux pump subunit AcrA (membrane-fusion protein)
MFVRIKAAVRTEREAVVVPSEAVITTPQGEHVVFVVNEGRAERRTIELGIESARRVQVTQGVSPGERVIVKGNEGLKDGAEVRIAGAGQGTPGPGVHRNGAPAGRRPEDAKDAQ